MARTRWLLLPVAGALALATAAPVALAQGTERRTGQIVDFDFEPRIQTIAAGTTVVWTNKGARPHTVTDRGGSFDTKPIQPNASKAVTFSVPGTYFVFCRINPGKMNGVVTVQAGGQPARVTRVQGVDPAREGEKLRFDPPNLSVQAGSAILFANVGGKPHTLTADDGTSFDTGVVAPGAEGGRFAGRNATITVKQPGRFPFHCEVHPQAMKGVLTVTGQATEAPAAASTAARQASVEVKDFEFVKPETSVAPAGTVTFRNTGNAPHTATFDDVPLDTGNIAPGSRGELTAPDKPGSYSYRCTIHPRMRAVLVVLGANEPDPTGTAAARAGPPPVAAGGGGPGGGLSALVLTTAVLGAFFGGFGISAFLRRRPADSGDG
jgi:plastocyanin